MPIEIKELTIKMNVIDPHKKGQNESYHQAEIEKKMVDATVEKVLRILERKAER